MPLPINLSPSTNENTLVDAIRLATKKNRTLNLLPGIHLTKPGYGPTHKIKLGANGLRIKGITAPRKSVKVKRPNYSIDLSKPDDNYGLFFIPADATDKEFASIKTWKRYKDKNNNTFYYAVIIRGSIEIDNLIIDCNMILQDLYGSTKSAEHSCMIGFSGTSTVRTIGLAHNKKTHKIFIGFKKVVIKNVKTLNGGFADDIWISRGYFNPNIEEVRMVNISSGPRVEPHRATIGFSGLVKKAYIENANISRLECEETSSKWEELPRKDTVYSHSLWTLKNITAESIDIAAKGKSIRILGDNLYAKYSCGLYQVGGIISNSIFNKGREPRLIRLNAMIFKKVTWLLSATSDGEMKGLMPVPQYNEECTVFFIENVFKARNFFTRGALISSQYSRTMPGNIVFVNLYKCTYDERFGTGKIPDTYVIKAMERGTWRIKKSDLGNRNKALFTNPEHKDVEIELI